MTVAHVEDIARRVLISLRRSGKIEIEKDFFPDLRDELAETIGYCDSMLPDDIARDVSDFLIHSEYVIELFASDDELAVILQAAMGRVSH